MRVFLTTGVDCLADGGITTDTKLPCDVRLDHGQTKTRTHGSLVPLRSFATSPSAFTTRNLTQAAGCSPSNGFLGPFAAMVTCAGVVSSPVDDFFNLNPLRLRRRGGPTASPLVALSESATYAESLKSGITVIDEELDMMWFEDDDLDRERGLNVDAASLSGLAASLFRRSPDWLSEGASPQCPGSGFMVGEM